MTSLPIRHRYVVYGVPRWRWQPTHGGTRQICESSSCPVACELHDTKTSEHDLNEDKRLTDEARKDAEAAWYETDAYFYCSELIEEQTAYAAARKAKRDAKAGFEVPAHLRPKTNDQLADILLDWIKAYRSDLNDLDWDTVRL